MKKWIKTIGLGLSALFLALLIVVFALFYHELKTLTTLKEVSPYPFYTMNYSGDYAFDEFLKVGATSDKEIERFVIKRLLKGIDIDLNITAPGCTAFTGKNSEGQVLFGRNFDFDYAPSLLLTTRPKNGYASISMVNLAFAGYGEENLPVPLGIGSFISLGAPYLPFDGMNECGVTIALLAVPYAEPPQKQGQISLNTTTGIRLVLDKAATTQEAVALLKQYNFYFSGGVNCHYLIADASGDSAVVEFMEGEVQVIKAEKPYQIASNFIQYQGLNIGEGDTEFERYDAVEAAFIAHDGRLTSNQAMTLLEEVQIPDRTQWSLVYNLSEKKVDICINKNYDQVYTYSLNP